ncbi:hypothetical protein [Nannocystis exedens]|uniref:hypothetical protein n=1 Tax=Nannocystis exedens TaxID=54 RepID=UPI001160B292|nr:hypothetical protein [Nannocystis exedens]
MTPAAALDKVLPRWRARLPPLYSPEFIDGFIRRDRAALETLVERAMVIRRAKRIDRRRRARRSGSSSSV